MIKTEYRVQGSADITIAVVADLHERKPDQVRDGLRRFAEWYKEFYNV